MKQNQIIFYEKVEHKLLTEMTMHSKFPTPETVQGVWAHFQLCEGHTSNKATTRKNRGMLCSSTEVGEQNPASHHRFNHITLIILFV